MKATILAAGRGRRLGAFGDEPKILLRFGGESLLARHLAILRACGVDDVALVVGFNAASIERELARLGETGITLIGNPRYLEGSIVSFWQARDRLGQSEPAILMDGDVIYDVRMMRSLLDEPAANCLLMDRNIEPGDEPVKLCVRDGRIVDFHKRPTEPHDWHGESVGFFRLAGPEMAAIIAAADELIEGGGHGLEYEEAIRLVMQQRPERFGFADVTGLPWTEIDFPEDVEKAEQLLDELADAPTRRAANA
jgi:choline kinase